MYVCMLAWALLTFFFRLCSFSFSCSSHFIVLGLTVNIVRVFTLQPMFLVVGICFFLKRSHLICICLLNALLPTRGLFFPRKEAFVLFAA